MEFAGHYFILYNSCVVPFRPTRPQDISILRRQKCVSGWAMCTESSSVYVHVAGSDVYATAEEANDPFPSDATKVFNSSKN